MALKYFLSGAEIACEDSLQQTCVTPLVITAGLTHSKNMQMFAKACTYAQFSNAAQYLLAVHKRLIGCH